MSPKVWTSKFAKNQSQNFKMKGVSHVAQYKGTIFKLVNDVSDFVQIE